MYLAGQSGEDDDSGGDSPPPSPPPPPAEPAPADPPAPTEPTPPAEPQQPPPPTPERLPAVKVRPENEQTFSELREFKQYQAEGGKLSLKEWARETAAPAAAPPADPLGQPPPAPPEPTAPAAGEEFQTLEQIQVRMDAIKEEMEAATAAWELPAIGLLQAESNALSLRAAHLAMQHADQASARESAAQEAQAQFETETASYTQQAVALFGAAVNDGASPLSQRAAEILTAMEASGDPLAHQPVAALLIYSRAAADLGVPAGAASAARPAVPPAAPAPVVSSPAPSVAPSSIIAGGDSRSHATRSAVPDITPDNYEEMIAKYKSGQLQTA